MESNIAISSTKEIIGMRNRIVHAYDNIDDNFIWVAIKKHLPILEEEIKELIKIRNIEI